MNGRTRTATFTFSAISLKRQRALPPMVSSLSQQLTDLNQSSAQRSSTLENRMTQDFAQGGKRCFSSNMTRLDCVGGVSERPSSDVCFAVTAADGSESVQRSARLHPREQSGPGLRPRGTNDVSLPSLSIRYGMRTIVCLIVSLPKKRRVHAMNGWASATQLIAFCLSGCLAQLSARLGCVVAAAAIVSGVQWQHRLQSGRMLQNKKQCSKPQTLTRTPCYIFTPKSTAHCIVVQHTWPNGKRIAWLWPNVGKTSWRNGSRAHKCGVDYGSSNSIFDSNGPLQWLKLRKSDPHFCHVRNFGQDQTRGAGDGCTLIAASKPTCFKKAAPAQERAGQK